MIVDVKVDYKKRKLLLIKNNGAVEERDTIAPYFYVICKPSQCKSLQALLPEIGIKPDWRTPVILKNDRYEPDTIHKVYKIYTESPSQIPDLSSRLKSLGFRVSAHNVRYVVRNCFDLDIRFYDIVPLYRALDITAIDKIRRVKALVIDVEVVEGKPRLVSVYEYSPLSEIQKDNIESLWLPEDQERLEQLIRKYPIIAGHNIVGFDIPVLKRYGILVEEKRKLLFDTTLLLVTYGNSLGVGSARSLLDVATILKEDAGITDDELELKKRVKGRIDKLSKEELVKYNVNDVVLTAKLLNIFMPFVFVISGLTQIPPSEVLSLPSGMVAEYFLLRYIELLGYIPEYSPINARLSGERVYAITENKEFHNILHTDIKMTYPSWVLSNYVDPTLHIGGEEFDRRTGIGLIYSAVKRLATVRATTKKLKKQNPLYEPMDRGVKAIINALAYGTQSKKSGDAILGNPWCPQNIFYGTMRAQFDLIHYLNSKGYRVVYSDTDSFFIQLECDSSQQCEDLAKKIVIEANQFLSKYGLELDVEKIWDYMYIYSKKNYIIRKGDIIIVKGSALRNLDRYWTPECISFHELLKLDRHERLSYIKEAIYNASVEDLFVRSHQQLWRLLSLDVQSWKRKDKDKRNRNMRVRTPWIEKPTLILKKSHVGHLLLPHSNPLFRLFIEYGNVVRLEDLDPFSIIELRSLRVEDSLRSLKAKYGVGDLLVYLDGFYTVFVKSLKYGIEINRHIVYYETNYDGFFPSRPIGKIVEIVGDVKVKKIEVDEELLRRLVFEETKRVLKDKNLL